MKNKTNTEKAVKNSKVRELLIEQLEKDSGCTIDELNKGLLYTYNDLLDFAEKALIEYALLGFGISNIDKPAIETFKKIRAVDKEIKIKKEIEMEEFFLEKLNSCEKVMNENYPDSVFFKCREGVLFEQDNKNKIFWVSYGTVWSVFYDRFKFDYGNTELFIKAMVEKHLKLEGFTPILIARWKRWLANIN